MKNFFYFIILFSVIQFLVCAQPSYIICPKCQFEENKESNKYCEKCGETFITEILCSKCGYINHEGDKYCMNCMEPFHTAKAIKIPKQKRKKTSLSKNSKNVSAFQKTAPEWSASMLKCFYFYQAGELNSSLNEANNALKIIKIQSGKNSSEKIDCILTVAFLETALEKFKEAHIHYLNAEKLAQIFYGTGHRKYAEIKNQIAKFYMSQGELDYALTYFKDALKIYEKKYQSLSSEILKILKNMKTLYHTLNKTEDLKQIEIRIRETEDLNLKNETKNKN